MPLFRALAKNMAASYFSKKAPYGFVMEVTLLYVFILWHYCCSVSFLVHIWPILHLDVYSICFLMQMLLAFALYFPAMRCLFNLFPHFRCLLALNRAVARKKCNQNLHKLGKWKRLKTMKTFKA